MPYAGPIIDAHHHLWDLALGAHPWIAGTDPAMQSLGNLDFLQQPLDLCTAQTAFGIGEHAAGGFKML